MSSLAFIVIGVVAGTYANNPKFKVMVDKNIKSLLSHGIDAINKVGGGIDDAQFDEEQP